MSGFTWWGTEIYKQVSFQYVCMESYDLRWRILIAKMQGVDKMREGLPTSAFFRVAIGTFAPTGLSSQGNILEYD